MSILFVLIALGLALMGAAVWAFFWAVGQGQFDDLDSPASSILGDDETQDPRQHPAP
jgi:cbb3-type cytochrome oxidase maturation protein